MREGVPRRSFVFATLLLAAAGAVHAQGKDRGRAQAEQKELARLRELVAELRGLPAKAPGGVPRRTDQIRILEEIAKVNHPQAVRTLLAFAYEGAYAPVLEDLLRILASMPHGDEAQISRVMREHMAPDDPARRIARDYLLGIASRKRNDEWLIASFTMGTLEDKFLALQAMGEIGSVHAVDCADALRRDPGWTPQHAGLVSCGTIAASLRSAEGPQAAKLLLLLTKDPRFAPADAARLREATRLWRQTDLRAYVNIAELADRDPGKRREAAVFLGVIGLEAARAPLLQLARNPEEPADVRAAAAAALGGMRIARGHLAEQLGALLLDPDPLVRRGAGEGLLRLGVRQSAEAFVPLLAGERAGEARQALGCLSGLPPETDWPRWLAEQCALPEGT
jgi:hypothetical protein